MIRAFKISPVVLCTTVCLLVIGELISGTSLLFTAMMAVAMLSVAVTYNLLGGMATFAGMIFASFALRTIVISQFAKVLLFEAADKNLESAQLTISVYAVFFLSAMVGVFIFGKVRLRLPKPMEVFSESQANFFYAIAFLLGLAASLAFEFYSAAYGSGTEFTGTRSAGLAFGPMLLFSLVMAVQIRIQKTNGRHSFGIAAFLPWAAAVLFGFIDTVRGAMLMPTIVYFATCYLRGYRFQRRHFAAAGIGLVAFFYFIGPLELFTRSYIANQPFSERAYLAFHVLATHHNPVELRNAVEQGAQSGGGATREQYYSRPGTVILSRLALIRADSNLISACSTGIHYGLAGIKIEIVAIVPRFLYKNKPHETSAGDYIGRISGVSGDAAGVSYPAMSAVSDSYGAFGWLGVVLFPLFFLPMVFIVYESVFNISQPWGTVVLGMSVAKFAEMGVSGFLPFVIRTPIAIVLLSYLVGGFIKMIPMGGHAEIRLREKLPTLGEG